MAENLKDFIEYCLKKHGGSELICTEVSDTYLGYHFLSGMHAFIYKDADGYATGFSMYSQPPLALNELYLDSLPIHPSLVEVSGDFNRELSAYRIGSFSVSPDSEWFTTGDEGRCLMDKEGEYLQAAVCGKDAVVHIPEGVKDIAPSALRGCRVSPHLPSTLRGIESEAFKGCFFEPEGTLVLPEGMIGFEDFVFRNVLGLREIRFPASLRCAGQGILADMTQDIKLSIAPGNRFYRVENNCLISNHDNRLITAGTQDRRIVIPEGVKVIGYASIAQLPYLSSVDIPSSVERIESADRDSDDRYLDLVTCNDYEVGPDGAPVYPEGPQSMPEIRIRAGSCAEEYCLRYGLKYIVV